MKASELFYAASRQLAARIGNFLLPPLCGGCQAPLADPHGLCSACWSQLNFITSPCCQVCGAPFDHDVGADAVCLSCAQSPPSFGQARASLVYDDASRKFLLGFKHGDRTHIARLFARWLLQAGGDFVRAADWIVPVPLHRGRLWRRRYNQAALLCHEIARLAPEIESRAVPLCDALVRTRATPRQHGNREKRNKNIACAFAVRENRRDSISGKSILLIDDVMTTGATVEACAAILRASGAATVNVLTVARTGALSS